MGASVFMVKGVGSTAKEAFETLISDAKHENGYGGYTGTIAEKDTFVMVKQGPVEGESAELLADKLINEGDARIDDKWGPAGCIELTERSKDGRKQFLFFGWASS